MDKFDLKVQGAFDKAVDIVSRNMIKFLDDYPKQTTNNNGLYEYGGGKGEWCRGFWAGIYWLAYEMTHNNIFSLYAQRKTDELIISLKTENVFHSDLGFLTLPSCAASYKLMKSESSREGAVYAADQLLARYVDGIGIIADPEQNSKKNASIKISHLINMQLLNWAYRITSSNKYLEAAQYNIDKIIEYNISDSGDVFFRYYFDLEREEPLFGKDLPNGAESKLVGSQSRGKAWAIYGLALSYATTKSEAVFNEYVAVTDKFLSELNRKYICYRGSINYKTKIPDVLAMAVAVCGILEMAQNISTEITERHSKYARHMLCSIIDNFSVSPDSFNEGLLRGCALEININDSSGACNNISTIQGDYFYLEALVRSIKAWEPYWY